MSEHDSELEMPENETDLQQGLEIVEREFHNEGAEEAADIARALALSLEEYRNAQHLTEDTSSALLGRGESSQDNYEAQLEAALAASTEAVMVDQLLSEKEYLQYLDDDEKALLPFLELEDKKGLIEKIKERQHESSRLIAELHKRQQEELEEAMRQDQLRERDQEVRRQAQDKKISRGEAQDEIDLIRKKMAELNMERK